MSLFKVNHHSGSGSSGYNAISTAEATSIKNSLANITQRFVQSNTKLRSDCQFSTTQWSGPAQQAFASRLDTDLAKFKAFENLLEEYQTVLGNIISQYKSTEQSNINIVKS